MKGLWYLSHNVYGKGLQVQVGTCMQACMWEGICEACMKTTCWLVLLLVLLGVW